ncbi:ABC transporter ATP-binding protein [Halobacteriales archaeon QS_1_68_20]|nr:MAG: ABC transporter ATP-binding protein [Halobacteriales archaeon QS_1_68_20]
MTDSDPAIAVENLTKTYTERDGETVTAVDDVSLEVERGTVVGVLGPNGAGKTTAIKSILGLVVPSSGTVRVDGVDVSENPAEAYRSVGAVLEGARNVYWRLTVRENLEFFSRLHGHDSPADDRAHEEYVRTLNFEDKLDELVNDLSRGMKQKTALACTFARRTPILFLDEPTLGLDVETSRDLRRQLRELVETEDRTVVLSSHDMDTVQQLCDRVVVMNEGEIVADESVEDLIDLFRTQSYRLTVAGELSDSTRELLAERFQASDWERLDGEVEFEVLLEHGDQLYDCMDVLRDAGVTPASVRALDPDLEEAFVRIIERERAAMEGPA